MRRARRLRSVRFSAAVLVSGMLVGPFAFPGAASSPTCASEPGESWVSLVPGFASGSADIVAYEVSPSDPKTIYVANDLTVRLSRDGGCTFDEIFDLAKADLSYDVSHATIADLDVAWEGDSRIFLAVSAFAVEAPDLEIPGIGEIKEVSDQHAVQKPHVIIGASGGSTWTEADEGLQDALGAPLDISVGGAGRSAYILLGRAAVTQAGTSAYTGQELFGSGDGGARWTKRHRVDGPGAGAPPAVPLIGVEADPIQPNEVWAFGPRGLGVSADGGSTFYAEGPEHSAGGLSIYRKSGAAGSCFSFSSNQAIVYLARDCSNWNGYPSVGIVTSVTHGDIAGELGYSTAQGHVYYVLPGVLNEIDVSDPRKAIDDLATSVQNGETVIFGRTLRTIERRAEPPPPREKKDGLYEPPPPPPPVPPGILDKLQALEEPRLLPKDLELELEPGESETVRLKLQLPGVRKVDVVYLIDMSQSMGDEISGLVQASGDISNALIEEGFHAYFGVGGYRSYTEGPAYRRFRDISPPGQGLTDALGEMRAGGGSSGDETATSALYQLATGEGQDEGGSVFIAAGQQMSFRPDALHLIVHGTDESLSEESPRPTITEAAAALVGVGAQQAGLAFRNTAANPILNGPPLASLQQVASLTGAVAPPTGVDCGGGSFLAAGAPLVCEVPDTEADLAANMGSAIVEIVKGLEDRRDVSLSVLDGTGQPSELVSHVSPERYPAIDFKLIHQLPFEVTVTCPGSAGEHELTVAARARGTVLADAELNLVCRESPSVADPRVPLAAAALIPPLPRPPQFNSPSQYTSNPVSQGQAQSQSQSQAQAQAGLVQQRQEQTQVAVVHQRSSSAQTSRASSGSSGSGDDLMMTKYTPRRSTGAPLGYYVAGYALAGLMTLAFVHASRPRRARVRVRRTS